MECFRNHGFENGGFENEGLMVFEGGIREGDFFIFGRESPLTACEDGKAQKGLVVSEFEP
jgi:hypothetical protein